MPTRTRFGAAKKRRVLELVAQGHTQGMAAEAVGVGRMVITRAKQADPEFAEAFQQAWEAGLDPMLDEARRRAVDGVEDFRLDRDGNEHPIRNYSDNLLMFLIKQRDPSFRENHRVEISGIGGGAVPVEVEGGRVTSLGDVVELARQLGIGFAAGLAEGARGGVGAGDTDELVSADRDVRPAIGPAAD